jgi:hypothetical protein
MKDDAEGILFVGDCAVQAVGGGGDEQEGYSMERLQQQCLGGMTAGGGWMLRWQRDR